jgi:hypothetical protein
MGIKGRALATGEIKEIIEEARRQYLTKEKMEADDLLYNDIWGYVNDAVNDRVISGSVTVRLEVSECLITEWRVTETKAFTVRGPDQEEES